MWFSVRHLLHNGPSYEERITIWDADDFEAALEWARDEAQDYAKANLYEGVLLPFFQVFRLFEDPVYRAGDSPTDLGGEAFSAAHGAEVFSLVRESDLDPAAYIESYYDTGGELETGRLRSWRSA